MDIESLILVGKLGRVISIKDPSGQRVEVALSTPNVEEAKKLGDDDMDVAGMCSYFISRIGDKEYGPADRELLKKGLEKIQGAVLVYINKQCLELLKEQEQFIEELTKK